MSSKSDLMETMNDALIDFYVKNDLEHCCALESLMAGNYKTTEQREWLEAFSHKWDQLQDEGLL
tara:strand:+ start:1414 stop:1605 length:192 start_codon:yes stop_codon:yes gene_type:complete